MGGGIGFPSGWEPVNPSGRPSSRCVAKEGGISTGLRSTTWDREAELVRCDLMREGVLHAMP